MNDETHIGLVNAHTKRICRHHHTNTTFRPVYLPIVLFCIRQTCVIVAGCDAILFQESGNLHRLLTCTGIDNRTTIRHSLQHVQHLSHPVLCFAHHINQILTLETHREGILLTKTKPLLYVVHHLGCGCGSQRHDGHIIYRQQLPNLRNLQIGRTKVITPLGDAMRLIHHHHAHLTHPFKLGQEKFGREAFWRNIQKFVSTQHSIVKHTDDVFMHHA